MQFILVLLFSLLVSGGAFAQDAGSTSGALQSSNLLNPNISAIGWLQVEAGRRHPGPAEAGESGNAIQMREVELSLQAVVDTLARADLFVAIDEDDVELEEGYLTWFRLPWNLALKAGKFKANFGRFNRIHTPETPFADRPLVQQNYFGSEGLEGPGASVSWQAPIPWFFMNLDLETLQAPEAAENPSFDRPKSKNLLGVGRLNAYQDLTEAWNLTLGGSAAFGPSSQEFDAVTGSSHTHHSQLYGADLTLRWKNPRRAVYRSFLWSTEALWSNRDEPGGMTTDSHGLFSYIDYQFARRWHTGFRYDYTQFPADGSTHEEGHLAYVTFTPSEFSLVSLQGRHVKRPDGTDEHLGFLKVTFNIGPHGAHPF
ncbi:MAG: hypothetical protein A2992_05460 [Elusimicrobia bacterium RIFCSPLOWO2_01_FULL_59_12]|nr:MAG: hypothetical protein A2992_05460 [Elusimicrobia bacterium RIFCSPLOWO2_01_FULL_59_12]